MKEYRVTITTVHGQWEYVLDAESKSAARTMGQTLANAAGWTFGLGTTTVERL